MNPTKSPFQNGSQTAIRVLNECDKWSLTKTLSSGRMSFGSAKVSRRDRSEAGTVTDLLQFLNALDYPGRKQGHLAIISA